MPDLMSKEQRSRLMANVRGRNTRFELALLRLLSAHVYPIGFRYRKHHRSLFGTPDVAFIRYRVVVFLDSDFWHGRNYDRLKDRMSPFWRTKIERNMERDREVNRVLRRAGWKVLRFGEKQVKTRPMSVVMRIQSELDARREHANSGTRVFSSPPAGKGAPSLPGLMGRRGGRTRNRILYSQQSEPTF
jgi:DNA mismatch endonuclease Vsr